MSIARSGAMIATRWTGVWCAVGYVAASLTTAGCGGWAQGPTLDADYVVLGAEEQIFARWYDDSTDGTVTYEDICAAATFEVLDPSRLAVTAAATHPCAANARALAPGDARVRVHVTSSDGESAELVGIVRVRVPDRARYVIDGVSYGAGGLAAVPGASFEIRGEAYILERRAPLTVGSRHRSSAPEVAEVMQGQAPGDPTTVVAHAEGTTLISVEGAPALPLRVIPFADVDDVRAFPPRSVSAKVAAIDVPYRLRSRGDDVMHPRPVAIDVSEGASCDVSASATRLSIRPRGPGSCRFTMSAVDEDGTIVASRPLALTVQ